MKLPRSRPTFCALDFETANYDRNSACAIGLVRVERGLIVRRAYHLVRPPSRVFRFTELHGIDWAKVRNEPTFLELWPQLVPFFAGVDFIAAHNASFDRCVLKATCEWYRLRAPTVDFECTVRIARASWGLRPATLRHVADHLGIPLRHHHAGSDAEACARIVLAAAA